MASEISGNLVVGLSGFAKTEEEMQLSDELRKAVVKVITERIHLEDVQSVTIDSVEVDQDKEEISITLLITVTSDAKPVADNYFGLTRRVRNALGDEWQNYFPVINPKIDRKAHA